MARKAEKMIKNACVEALKKDILKTNARQAKVLIDQKTGEFLLSCPECIVGWVNGSRTIELSASSLGDAIWFIRKIARSKLSGYRPNERGAHCPHIPEIVLKQHRTVFMARSSLVRE